MGHRTPAKEHNDRKVTVCREREETIKELEPQGVTDIFNISVKDNSVETQTSSSLLSELLLFYNTAQLFSMSFMALACAMSRNSSTISKNFDLLAC